MQQVNMRDRSGRVLTTLVVHADRMPVVAPIIAGRYDLRGVTGIRRVLDVGAGEGAFANWIWAVTGGCWVDCWEPDAALATLCASQLPPGGRMLPGSGEGALCPTIQDDEFVSEERYDLVRNTSPHYILDGGLLTIVDWQRYNP